MREYAARSILPHLNMASRTKEQANIAELNFYGNNAANATLTVASSAEENDDRRLEMTNSTYDNSFIINPEEMSNAEITNTDNNLYFYRVFIKTSFQSK